MGSNNKLIPGINDLATINPSIAKEWNYQKNDGLRPELVSANSHKKVWWTCSLCGREWETAISTRNTSGSVGCPNCNKKKAAQERRQKILREGGDFASKHPDLLDEWNYEKNGAVRPTDITPRADVKVWWRCRRCGKEWQAWIGDRSRGISLLIRNRGKKIEFLSEALDADTNMECTAFYPLFARILAENPQLTAEEDVFGEKIDYWYKIRKTSEAEE